MADGRLLRAGAHLDLLSLEALAAARHLDADVCLAAAEDNEPLQVAATRFDVVVRTVNDWPDRDLHPAFGARSLVPASSDLLSSLASSDEELRSPSLLPDYSRRDVVAHVINETQAHVWLFGGPPAGEVRRLHADGYDADRAAKAGARRSTVELRADLGMSFEQLEGAWETLDDGMWSHEGIMTAGPRTMAEIVTHHLRDVEVRAVDLDIGCRPSDWPARFVEVELPKRLRSLPDRADNADLLAWLLGRAPAPDLGPW